MNHFGSYPEVTSDYDFTHSFRRNCKVRKWEVIDGSDKRHEITAHYCFNNGDEGLVFRTYPPGAEKTVVVAAFAQGQWKLYKEIING